MPVSVSSLFEAIGAPIRGRVVWGDPVSASSPGVYAVAVRSDPADTRGKRSARFDEAALEDWIASCPAMRLQDERPTPETLGAYLRGFWLADEPIVYIGKATCLRRRLRQFFRHRLGRPSPHAGGQWLKTLEGIGGLHVFFAATDSADEAAEFEARALEWFGEHAGRGRRGAPEPGKPPMPFANLRHPSAGRKQRGLRGQSNKAKVR